jgi:hypothetical protein
VPETSSHQRIAMPPRRAHAALLLLGTLLAVGGAPASAGDAVGEVPPPASWGAFTILNWQINTNAERDRALYESVNLHGFHIDRKDDALQAFARASGWPYYLDHAADKGYLHLGDNAKDPKVAAVTRKKEIIIRPNSLADPATIEKMHACLRERITAAKGSPVVAYAFDDEIGLGNFCSPAEVDGHPLAVAFYQKQLEAQYGTVARLNQQYGSSYAAFSAIAPKSFEAFRGQLSSAGIATLNLSQWCDWRSAMDSHFAAVLSELTRFANSIDPGVPAGFVGGQGPNAWGGYDYHKLSKAVQWMEAYDIGGSNEILRSLWSQKRPHVQTFFSSRNPHLDAWFLWYYLCQGNRGVISWPEDWFKDGKVADNISALAATFKEVQGPLSRQIIDGEFEHDGIAIYYSHPSIQLNWALDAACHGGTWANRSSSMDNAISTSNLARIAWLKSLQDVGVQPTFIDSDRLLDGALQKGRFKMLVLSRTLCLGDAEVAAVQAFARAGGSVVADHLCAICDEHGKVRPAGALDELFAVKRELAKGWFNGSDLTEVNGELGGRLAEKNWALGAPRWKGLAVVERGLAHGGGSTASEAEGLPVVVRSGKAVYLNLSPIGYLLHRSDGAAADWLATLSGLLSQAGVAPRVALTLDGAQASMTEALFWRNGARTTVCVLKNLDRAAAIDGFGDTKGGIGEAKARLGLRFASALKGLRNERTGRELGDGASFEDDFTPWEANVYSFAR